MMETNTIGKSEMGRIQIFYLKKIWSQYIRQASGQTIYEKEVVEWKYINAVLNTLGLGMEPTIKYLYSETPNFNQFEDWIFKNGIVSDSVIELFNSIVNRTSESTNIDNSIHSEELILSEQDLKDWDKNGYVIIKQAISPNDCEAAKRSIYNFIGAIQEDKMSWYEDHPNKQGIMVQLFNNEVLNKNRLSNRIRIAYQQLWNRSDLLVSMDRVSFNPPENENYHFPGPNLHWDVSLKRPIPFGLQGLLYLTDTSETQGAFTLVPGFHKKIDTWLNELGEGVNPRTYDFEKLNPKALAGKAGDFIIWNQALPHGSCPNRADEPRVVQYINYQPIDIELQSEWI